MQQAYTLKTLITNTICADISLRERSNHHRRRKGQTPSPKKGRFYGRQWADPGHRAAKRASSPKKGRFYARQWADPGRRVLKPPPSPKKGHFCARQWADPGRRVLKPPSSPKKCTFLRRRWFMLSGHTLKCIVAHPEVHRSAP